MATDDRLTTVSGKVSAILFTSNTNGSKVMYVLKEVGSDMYAACLEGGHYVLLPSVDDFGVMKFSTEPEAYAAMVHFPSYTFSIVPT